MKKQSTDNLVFAASIVGMSIIVSAALVIVALCHQAKDHTEKIYSAMQERTCGEVFAADQAANKQSFQLKDGSCFIKYSDGQENGAALTSKRF